MVSLHRFLALAVTTLAGKAFQTEPNYIQAPRHPTRSMRRQDNAQTLTPWSRPEQMEAVAGLNPEPGPGVIEVIKNSRLEIIGYRETRDSCQVLRDKNGRKLGVYDHATKVTRDRHGQVIGLNTNQLLRLL